MITNSDQILFLGCLYARSAEGHSFPVVTRPAGLPLAHIHDRIPVILSDPNTCEKWLAPPTISGV